MNGIESTTMALVLTTALALAGQAPVHAQETSTTKEDQQTGLQEIVVTATKRSESLQNVPIAVTAVSGDLLKSASIDAGADLPRLTPNLTINSGSAFFAPYLRGIGTQYSNLGLESSVATYFDDLYYSRPQGGLASFNDIQRVEVLKGPQGTLFGRNAAGGAIRIISNDPVLKQFDANAAATYGSFHRIGVEGMLNVPLGETVAARFAYYHDEREGNIRNIDPAQPRSNNRHINMIRGKILWEPSDALKVKLSTDYTDKNDREGAEFLSLAGAPTQLGVVLGGAPSPSFYVSSNDSAAQLRVQQFGTSLRVDLEKSIATFSSISGYRWSRLYATGSDLDTVNIPFQHDNYLESSGSLSQEFQAVSNNSGPWSWIAGVYYFRESGHNIFNIFGSAINASFGVPDGPNVGIVDGGAALNARSDVTTKSFAPYVEASYQLSEQFKLSLGARYTWEDKNLRDNHVFATGVAPGELPLFPAETDKTLKFEQFTPKVTLSYIPVNDVLLYLTYSKGFKSGGFNTPAFTPVVGTVQPEKLTSYEFGWKTEFEPFRFNGSAFYYDFKDLQIQRTDQTSGGTRIENAAAAKIYGVEADFTWAAARGLEFGAGGGLLKTKYKDYIGDANVPGFSTPTCIAAGGVASGNPACFGYAVQSADFSGVSLQQAPKESAYVRGQYEIPLTGAGGSIRLNALYSYTGEFFYNPEHSLSEPSKSLVNAGISWLSPDDRYQVTLFGDNLTDVKYDILQVRQATGGWHIPALPRTWGVKVAAKF